jgi:2-polyprenyl-3-methyl-5-hydroxy-6-metoxy-1,4-benzoquinol methylase
MSVERRVPICKICSGDREIAPSFSCKGYDIWRCGSCTVEFVSPQPEKQFLQSFYADESFYQGRVYGNYLGDPQRRAFFHAAIENLEQSTQGKGRLLDIGCGPGLFLDLARSRGWDVSGIELSRFAVEYATCNLHLPVTMCNLTEANIQPDSFDVVTLWDTVEHLDDPCATVKEIHRILRPGGKLFLTTGEVRNQYAWLLSKLYGLQVCWYDPPQHLFFFTRKSLVTLFQVTGFSQLRLGNLSTIRPHTWWSFSWWRELLGFKKWYLRMIGGLLLGKLRGIAVPEEVGVLVAALVTK